jgi:hypothetical protein
MSEEEQQAERVTDADIEAIIAQGEPGVAELVAAYEPIEQHYLKSQRATAPPISSSTVSVETRC